ncbi:MAG: dihydrodipicolinate synthase family protein, partial [Thermodesulfobacteriota bacterium]|nr:dihydrodipicolinate synthase family protein [Thermodesulfobacteriota bacterium]
MTDQSPQGLISALITPLDPNLNIDKESLKTLLEHMMNDLHLVLIGSGDTGEGFSLDNRKRMELIRASMEIVNGRIPLFLSITGNTEDQTGENIIHVERSFKDLNYKGDIFLLDCPLWHHSNKGLSGLYNAFGRLSSLPFVLYNNPFLISELKKNLKRKNIRTNILKQMSENDQIIGIIHVGGLKRAMNYARAVRARRGFRIYDGNELNFLTNPSLDGVVALGA